MSDFKTVMCKLMGCSSSIVAVLRQWCIELQGSTYSVSMVLKPELVLVAFMNITVGAFSFK
jgi:hypothetical protein